MVSRVSSQVTTVSQSEQLLAAGIPADRASMFWVRKVVEVDVNGDGLWGSNPVYFACIHLIDAVFQSILQLQTTGRLVHRIPSAG